MKIAFWGVFFFLTIPLLILADDHPRREREALLDQLVDCLDEISRREFDPTVSHKAFQGLVKRCRAIVKKLDPPLAPGERGIESSIEELEAAAKNHSALLADPERAREQQGLNQLQHEIYRKELAEELRRARLETQDPKFPYTTVRDRIWTIVVTRRYPVVEVTLEQLGTSRSELLHRLLAKKRQQNPGEYKNDWKDREIDAYLTTADPEFAR